MANQDVTGWVLCGGESRRVGGEDKGLLLFRDRPLADWVLQSLSVQVCLVHLNANRRHPEYAALLRSDAAGQVIPDDTDVSGFLGPLAGILTGLRRAATPWLLVVSCDTPELPGDLVARLLHDATAHGVDIAVPATRSSSGGEWDHHWVCALIHTRCTAALEAAIQGGERRVGRWIQSRRWVASRFDHAQNFININTLETLREQA